MDRNLKRELERRRQQGRPLLAGFLQRLSADLGCEAAEFELLDLLTTDNLADEFKTKLAECAGGQIPALCRALPAVSFQPQLQGRGEMVQPCGQRRTAGRAHPTAIPAGTPVADVKKCRADRRHTGSSWSITAASCLADRHSCIVMTS